MPAVIAFFAPLVSIFGTVVGFLATSFLNNAALKFIFFLAKKALLIFLMTVVLPVILYNLFSRVFFELMQWQLSYIFDSLVGFDSPAFVVRDIGGWLANTLRIDECFSIIMTCALIKLQIRVLGRFR